MKRANILDVFVSAYVIGFSLFLLPYNMAGDQAVYHRFYSYVQSVSLYEAITNARLYIGSSEPIYPIIIFSAGHIFAKNVFISIANGLLAFVTIRGLARYNLPRFWSYWLVTTNFYLLVLYTGAERLKFALLLFLIGLLAVERSEKRGIFFIIIACLTHIQTFFLIAGRLVAFYLSNFQRRIKKSNLLLIGLSLIILCVAAYGLRGHILDKFNYYYAKSSFDFGIAKVLIFYIASLYSSRSRRKTTYLFLPIIMTAIPLGGERLVILAFFFYLISYGERKRKFSALFLVPVMIYFSFKSIDYVKNILTFGDGFPIFN